MHRLSAILALLILCVLPEVSQAYVGPGAGLSLLGALWALLAAIGTAVVFVVAWPIRRLRRRKREAREQARTDDRKSGAVRPDPVPETPPLEREDEADRLQRQ